MAELHLDQLVEIRDFEAAARDQLSKMAYDFYAAGANDQVTLRENLAAFERILLSPKMLMDVSRIDLTTSILGMTFNAPFMIAPMAFQRMAHPDGELATARAAQAKGIAMALSTGASTSLEDVAAEGPEIRWFQVYVFKDRGVTRRLVQRAEVAGYKALALTVDTPKFGRRYADVRNKFHLPPGVTLANFAEDGLEQLGKVSGESGLAAYSASLFDPTLTWKDVEWLKSITPLPVLVKGVLRADDAVQAMDHGAAGIIVSNHGGRQLDTVRASIDALPRIAEVVDGRVPLLLDGGVRRGTDVLKALALGTQAVLIGRPILWGLAVAGQAGVEKVLTILRDEIELAMILAGVAKVHDVTRDVVET
jgi:isopentenyl diphosphate isomerase/L-lactate dehydrogenase-like FMN-dependent dehydrogenase